MTVLPDLDTIASDAVNNHNALQKPEELTWFLERVQAADTGAGFLEIGCDAGGTLWAISQVTESPIMGVTLPDGPFRTGRALQVDGSRIAMVFGDSSHHATFELVGSLRDGIRFDGVLIDGDHGAIAATWDVGRWAHFVRPGGFLALHDIVGSPVIVGVPQVWEWIRGPDRVEGVSESFVSEPQHWGGFGIKWRPMVFPK